MQIFSLFGEILLKDSGVVSKLDEIDKKGGTTSSHLDTAFSKIGSAALKLGGIIGLGMGFKDMISNASASQQKLTQMDSVLKSTGGAAGMTKDELVKLADAQGKLTTFSKGTNLETENLLLTFTNIGKKTFPDALTAVNDMSQALGQDTKSSAIQLGKALNDPVKGITALSRVGVSFTQQQKDQIAAMQKAGDTAGAQSIILKELQKEFGGSAEAAGKTFGGQLTILKNQISGVGTQIGSVLMPYLTNLVTNINSNMPKIKQVITDVINTVVPKFQEWVKIISQIVTEILPSLGKSTDDAKAKVADLANNGLNLVTSALQLIRDHAPIVQGFIVGLTAVWLIQKGVILEHNIALAAHNTVQLVKNVQDKIETAQIVALYVAQGVHTAATNAQAVATKALNLVMEANPIGLVIAAITALIAIGVILYNKSTTFRKFVNDFWDNLKKFVAGVKQDFEKLINDIGNGITNFQTKVNNIFTDIGNTFINLKNSVANTAKEIGTAVIEGINTAVTFITSLPAKALQWGKDFIQGFIDGIKSMMSAVGNAVSNVANTVKSFLHFSTPDEGPLKDYEQWPKDFMEGFAKGITDNKYKIADAVKGIGTDMKVNVKGAMTNTSNESKDSISKGITQNVYITSPTALSPSEIARQNKRALQELALQF